MAKKVTKNSSKWVARKYGFKSGLEENISNQIDSKGKKVYTSESATQQMKKQLMKMYVK